jgi:hypothetical protein
MNSRKEWLMDLKWNPVDYEAVEKAIRDIGSSLSKPLSVLGELPCPSPGSDKQGYYVVRLIDGKPNIVKIS